MTGGLPAMVSANPRRVPVLGWLCAALVWFTWTAAAQAGGIEYVGAGTTALGRGGAFAARADDPMALAYNPAALADLADTQLMLNLSNAFYSSCADRSGTYGSQVEETSASTDRFGDIADYRHVPFPEICQSNNINPGAWLAFALKPTSKLGIGFGILSPAAAGHKIWGDGTGATDDGMLPSPVRYQMIEQEGLIIQPTLGAAYRLTDWMRLGVSLQSGLAVLKVANMTVNHGTENPIQDSRADIAATDLFIPAVIASLQLIPHDNIELSLFGRYSDKIRAKGEVDVEVGTFSETLAIDSNDDVSLTVPQPGHVGMALRYAARRAPRQDGERGDPLRDERWDLELDAVYILASQFDHIQVDIPELPMLAAQGIHTQLRHDWSNQLSLRAGGDYNVIADRLALRAGLHYETSAIDGAYTGIDFQPAQRLGLHAGFSLRLGRADLSLAYAHIFQETIQVPWSDAAYRQIAAAAKPNPEAVVVNAATYRTAFDVVSFGVNFHFGS
jgi:long-subunit fatty acid transport protein